MDGRGEGRAVAPDIGVDGEVIAGKQDGAAMAADVASDDDGVAGAGEGAGGAHAGADFADAGGGDEDVVDLALARDFGVACDDAHARLGGGRGHRGDDLLQVGDGEALLDDEGAREVFGNGAHAGQVIDGAADGEFADVPARELPGGDDEAVGREGEFALGGRQDGGVVRGELRIGEVSLEDPPIAKALSSMPSPPTSVTVTWSRL